MSWHYSFVPWLASVMQVKSYLELGVFNNDNINRMVNIVDMCVGVDTIIPGTPCIDPKYKFLMMSTSEFFERNKEAYHLSFDMIFIDACHDIDNVISDFENSFKILNYNGVILIHDTYPMSEAFLDKGYCSNAYEVCDYIKEHFSQDGEIVTIPVHPGISIFRKCDRQLEWKK